MGSRRVEKPHPAPHDFWRQLASNAGWDISTAAKLLRISLRQLERLCHEELHCTPREFFHRERMATAARHLTSGLPAKVVSIQLGYSQLSNFSRDFKRHHGRTPRLFSPRPRLALPPPLPSKVLS